MTFFKKFTILLLALVLVCGQIGMTVGTYAEINNDEDEDEVDYTLSGEEYLKEIRGYRAEVESFVPQNESEQQMLDEFNEKSAELEEAMVVLSTPEAQGGPEAAMIIAQILELYPLHTIPKRIELLAQTVDIIRFASTELRDKPVEIQRQVAEFAIRGLVIAVMPGEINDQADEHLMAYQEMKDYWLDADDAENDDLANIYHKADLDKKLAEARSMKFNRLKNAPSYIYKELRAEVKRITKARLKSGVTKGEILKLGSELQAAVTKALENTDQIATKAEIKTLKKLTRECKRAARVAKNNGNDDHYIVLSNLVEEANEELSILNPKKSHIKIEALIDCMEFELGY